MEGDAVECEVDCVRRDEIAQALSEMKIGKPFFLQMYHWC